MSNAIFHSPVGELVDIQCLSSGDNMILTIENTGVHIGKDDLEHIFDPFYRIDKSRNRHTGGSGLGLYIVKRVLELHHVSYKIENSKEGVLFTMIFSLIS
jgi:two-component system sensor histidine kinase VanS